jgi:hypothetical protein
MSTETPISTFEKWWRHTGSALPIENSKLLASSVWDSAVFAAAKILDDEKNRLVQEGKYERAAVVRDYRTTIESAFTVAGQWKVYERNARRSAQIGFHYERLNKLSDSDLAKLTPPDEDSEFSIALKRVKQERQSTKRNESTDSP